MVSRCVHLSNQACKKMRRDFARASSRRVADAYIPPRVRGFRDRGNGRESVVASTFLFYGPGRGGVGQQQVDILGEFARNTHARTSGTREST